MNENEKARSGRGQPSISGEPFSFKMSCRQQQPERRKETTSIIYNGGILRVARWRKEEGVGGDCWLLSLTLVVRGATLIAPLRFILSNITKNMKQGERVDQSNTTTRGKVFEVVQSMKKRKEKEGLKLFSGGAFFDNRRVGAPLFVRKMTPIVRGVFTADPRRRCRFPFCRMDWCGMMLPWR